MPDINFIAIIAAALVPNIVGALFYGPLFGKTWLSSLGLTADDMKGRNEPLIYGSALLLSFVVAFFMNALIELTHKDVNGAGELVFGSFATFQHGLLHGGMIGMTMVVPVIICLGMFQKTARTNIILNCVYWVVCYALMGGIVDAWS